MIKKLLFSSLFSVCLVSIEWDDAKKIILQTQKAVPSLSSLESTDCVIEYIKQKRPFCCVEIGSFLGANTASIGLTMMYNQTGMLYSIDTWQYQPLSTYPDDYDQYAHRWKLFSFDGDAVYNQFLQNIRALGLEAIVRPIRINSLDAVSLFNDESIDLLYLDGDTERAATLEEVKAYLPKIKTGGVIILTKADIYAKSPAVRFLMENCTREKSFSKDIETIFFIK